MSKQILPPSCSIAPKRLKYIDVAKGVLIFMVIYSHTNNLAIASGVNNEIIDNFIPKTKFFMPFFMPAFFIIAGMCSNYHKNFKEFALSNAKALLIPAVLLLFVRIFVKYSLTGTFSTFEWHGLTSPAFIVNLGRYNWFLTSLFVTKMMFYAVLHGIDNFKKRIALVLIIHFTGVFLYNVKGSNIIYYNFYFYQHALVYLLFVEIGYDLYKGNLKSYGLKLNSIIFFIVYICYLSFGRSVPSITYIIRLPMIDIIPHLFMSVCGSLMLIEFSKKLDSYTGLQDFGKNSLVIYCLHFQFMFSYYQIFKEQLNGMGVHHTITALIIMYVFTAYGCLWFSKALNAKYFKWILGKF